MNVNRRRRRTAEESKAIVLDTAEKRLAQLGLEGLNIVGVAKAAGITHATLIHHFGSSAGMRRALVEHMTARLIDEAMATLNQDAALSTLFRDLFLDRVDYRSSIHSDLVVIDPDCARLRPVRARKTRWRKQLRRTVP